MWLPSKWSRRSLHSSCNKLASHTVRVLFFSKIVHDLLFLGRKCGSVFIDGKFKMWLRDSVLGPDDYEKLEPNTKKRIKPHSTTGRKMRDIMKVFIEHKRAFTGNEEPDHLFTIELPTEFGDLNMDGYVEEGLLTLD
jgi:hypothetical protein